MKNFSLVKSLLALSTLLALLFVYSCKTTDSTEAPVPSTSSKESFFDINNYKEIDYANDSSIRNAPENVFLIGEMIDDIRELDKKHHFSDDYVGKYGFPVWKYAIAYSNSKESGVFVPIIKSKSSFVGKLLVGVKDKEGGWRYQDLNIKNYDQKIHNTDKEAELTTEEFFKFAFLLLNQQVSGVSIPCSVANNVKSLSEQTIKSLKGSSQAKMASCEYLIGFDGYCEWGGTPQNQFAYFHGCFGTYTSTYVCDNPDAYWAQYTGTGIGSTGPGGSPTPPLNDFDASIPDAAVLSNARYTSVDCGSFVFKNSTTTSQEAAIRVNLRFAESDPGLDMEYDNFTLQFRYLRFTVPSRTYDNRIIGPGEAANASARAFNDAWDTSIQYYNQNRDALQTPVLMEEIKKTFLREMRSNLINNLDTGGAQIGTGASNGPPVKDVDFAFFFENPYDC